jgi:hypothetical protein
MHWPAPLPNQERAASAFCAASPLSVLSAAARSSRNLRQVTAPKLFGSRFSAATKPSHDVPHHTDYQCTVPLAPGPPGVNFPSSDVFSPGTGVPDVADWETESPLAASSDDAQAESSNATTTNRTARSAKRSFTGRTYLCGCLMQAAVSGRFRSEERR